MKVRIKSTGAYVGISDVIGKTFDAVKVNGNYSGYYVDIPISKDNTVSLYFLPWEVEEVDDFVTDIRTNRSFLIPMIILLIFLICNLIINLYV